MATNQFKAFAAGSGANVTAQAQYEALAALSTGFTSGTARSDQVNKALRQGSSIAAMIGQFIADAGIDAFDNGDVSTLLSGFESALSSTLSGRFLGERVFTANGTYTPTTGARLIRVRVQGGGGGGGSTPAVSSGNCAVGSGGASGAYAEAWFLVAGTSAIVVTVGAGGAAAAGTAGNSGGTSSLGTLVSAPGGGGGQVIQNATTVPAFFAGQGSASGAPTVTGAQTTVSAAGGHPGACGLGFAGTLISGQGAPSIFGGGGNNTSSGAGSAASAYGAGGSGAATSSSGAAALGGSGASGIVVITEFS